MARFPIRPGRGRGTSAHPSASGPEHASSTYLQGAVLVNDATPGFLTEASADPTTIIGISEEKAKNNATAGAGVTRYTPVIPSLTFEATVDKASTLGLYALLATDLYAKYGITKDSAGIWYIDVDKTTSSARVVITEFKDPVGTVDARVFCVFLMADTIYA